MVLDIRIGDVVRLRKGHPCGGNQWEVVRLGADIGLRCEKCGRRVLLGRSQLERRIKMFVTKVVRHSLPTDLEEEPVSPEP